MYCRCRLWATMEDHEMKCAFETTKENITGFNINSDTCIMFNHACYTVLNQMFPLLTLIAHLFKRRMSVHPVYLSDVLHNEVF